MEKRQILIAGASLVLAGGVLATAAAMTPRAPVAAKPVKPALMESLKVAGLSGYRVRDSSGAEVGRVLAAETDNRGRTRYVRFELSDGEQVRIAAFHAYLAPDLEEVDLTLPIDAVLHDPGAVLEDGPRTAIAAAAASAG